MCDSIRKRNIVNWFFLRNDHFSSFPFFFLSSSDPKNRTLYQSCLQNAMTIISALIDHQVEHSKANVQTTTNLFASKVLIKVCLDFLLQTTNDIKAPICLRCLTSLAKVNIRLWTISSLETSNRLDHTGSFNSLRKS